MSALGAVGGAVGGLGSGGAIGAVGGNSWSDGTIDSSPAAATAWNQRAQSYDSSQVTDYRGGQYDASKNTVTFERDHDFRGGGIGADDRMKQAALAVAPAGSYSMVPNTANGGFVKAATTT
jgi:hypothetical protein